MYQSILGALAVTAFFSSAATAQMNKGLPSAGVMSGVSAEEIIAIFKDSGFQAAYKGTAPDGQGVGHLVEVNVDGLVSYAS